MTASALERFNAQTREEQEQRHRILEVGPDRAQEESASKEWEDAAITEADLLEERAPVTVTLSTGEQVTVKEPNTGAWAIAFGRIGKAVAPIAAAMDIIKPFTEDDLKDPIVSMAIASRVFSVAGSNEEEAEESAMAMLRIMDALLGKPKGTCSELALEDTLSLLAALIRVIDIGRFKVFFRKVLTEIKRKGAAPHPAK